MRKNPDIKKEQLEELITDKLEPLGLEHFYFPLLLLSTGLLLAALCFLAEIIIKWIGN